MPSLFVPSTRVRLLSVLDNDEPGACKIGAVGVIDFDAAGMPYAFFADDEEPSSVRVSRDTPIELVVTDGASEPVPQWLQDRR